MSRCRSVRRTCLITLHRVSPTKRLRAGMDSIRFDDEENPLYDQSPKGPPAAKKDGAPKQAREWETPDFDDLELPPDYATPPPGSRWSDQAPKAPKAPKGPRVPKYVCTVCSDAVGTDAVVIKSMRGVVTEGPRGTVRLPAWRAAIQ